MERLEKNSTRDFKIDILEGRRRYLVQAREFRLAILKEKQKLLKKKEGRL